MEKNGSIGIIHGIIISKLNYKYLNDIIYKIGNIPVCTFNIGLLIKLYGRELNDDLFYIPIPKKFIINESIDQKILDPLNVGIKYLDIEQMYGIPLFCLNFHEVRIDISMSKGIDFYLMKSYTREPKPVVLKISSIPIPVDHINKNNIFEEKLIKSIVFSSCEKIEYDMKKMNPFIGKNNNDIIKISENGIISTIISMDYFKLIVSKYKNMSSHHMIFRELTLKELCIIIINIPIDISEIIISYGHNNDLDSNFDILIYDYTNEYENYKFEFYKIYNSKLIFDYGLLMSVDSNYYKFKNEYRLI